MLGYASGAKGKQQSASDATPAIVECVASVSRPTTQRTSSYAETAIINRGCELMSQSTTQPELEEMKDEADAGNETLATLADNWNFLYVQFRTQLRNLHLAYMHAFTQSKYELAFYDNGAIKSISPPKGWSE